MFLDRDGVVNRRPPAGTYVTYVAEFDVLAGVPEAIRRLNDTGFLVCVVTNQRGLALKALSEGALTGIHAEFGRRLSVAGAALAGVYVCPHDLDAGCACRKPRPGLLVQAAAEHGIDLSLSWMIGDSESDILAGKRARCRTIFIGTAAPRGGAEAIPDFVAPDLPRAVDLIMRTVAEGAGDPPASVRGDGPVGR